MYAIPLLLLLICIVNSLYLFIIYFENRLIIILSFSYNTIICQIKRDKTFHLRNSKKLLMVFGNLVIF